MKQRIETKIGSIIDFIINKPEDKITADDYMILSSELRDIRFREADAANKERMGQFMASAFPIFHHVGE